MTQQRATASGKAKHTPSRTFKLNPARCRTLTAVLALTLTSALAACAPQPDPAAEGKLPVMASFYPLEFVAQRVGGEQVHVTSLTPSGADPHAVELSPAAVRQLDDTQVLIYLSGFQPAVDQAVAQHRVEHTVDAHPYLHANDDEHAHEGEGEHAHEDDHGHEDDHAHEDDHGHHHHEGDPHFWLDPLLLADLTKDVEQAFSAADPENAQQYAARSQTLISELQALDAEFSAGLNQCKQDTFIVTHEAFGFLANKYGLHQVGIGGLDPEQEPSPARLKEVSTIAQEHGVSTIFYERLISDKIATTLAQDLGLKTDVLDPLEGLVGDSGDYFSIMRENLAALSGALDCQ